ncbi:MAG: hypothetical protein Greene041679_300 [Parcubacteria group bacterium Greene0416_79]|nr:MAG: hypothetical protein Greene041679_300 [Parcubacteria group bacterium Greene0416_79]
MTIITIPKHLARKDLVLIPKEEYEALTRARVFKEVPMTKAQKRAFERAERNYAKGNFVTLDVLRRDLERRNSR